jgi:hypothetical protein
MLLLFLASHLAAEDFYLQNAIDYLTANASTETEFVLFTRFAAQTLVTVPQAIGNFTISYLTGSGTNHFPDDLTVEAPPNTEIRLTLSPGAFVRLAYAAIPESLCSSITVTTRREEIFTHESSGDGSVDACLLYAPVATRLRYNIQNSVLNDKYDSLTIFHEEVSDVWYDRYESMSEPSGWSASSDRPWFFHLSIQRPTAEKSPTNVTIELAGEAVGIDVTGEKSLFVESPLKITRDRFAIRELDLVVPVIGCLAPALLLASWGFGFWRLKRQAPMEEIIEPADV